MVQRRWLPSSSPTRSAAAILLAALLIGCDSAGTLDAPTVGGDPAAELPDVVGPAALIGLTGPWQPQPLPIWPALIESVARECSRSMQPFPAAPLVAVDARGEGRLQAVFAGPGGMAACYDMTVDATGAVAAMGGGMTGMAPGPPPIPAQRLQSAGVSSSGGGGQRITSSTIIGQAGPGISTVVAVLPGRGRITATLENGWYVMWWPGELPGGTKVIGLDAAGVEVAEIPP